MSTNKKKKYYLFFTRSDGRENRFAKNACNKRKFVVY